VDGDLTIKAPQGAKGLSLFSLLGLLSSLR